MDEFQALIERSRKHQPELDYVGDIEVLVAHQAKLLKLKELKNNSPGELTDFEKDQLQDLEMVNEYLQ